jgi:hypothetical protein
MVSHRARLYVYSSSMFCDTQSTTELNALLAFGKTSAWIDGTHLNITKAFAMTFAMPKYSCFSG